MIDATYKLNELQIPVYLMVVIDCNGQSEIIGVFVTASETEEAIAKMLLAFIALNPEWLSTPRILHKRILLSELCSGKISLLPPS